MHFQNETVFSILRTGILRCFGLGDGDTQFLSFLRVSSLLARGDFNANFDRSTTLKENKRLLIVCILLGQSLGDVIGK